MEEATESGWEKVGPGPAPNVEEWRAHRGEGHVHCLVRRVEGDGAWFPPSTVVCGFVYVPPVERI